MQQPKVDFGWRLHGKMSRLLNDSSLVLLPPRQAAALALLKAYSADEHSAASCLQCGVCTAVCQLADSQGATFPRHQMMLLQLGDIDKLLADPCIWLCFNCKDCATHCPANAGPGQMLAVIRRLAVERYSVPRWWSQLVNQWRGFLSVLLVAAAILLVAIAAGGSFLPLRASAAVRYADMLPDSEIKLLFGTLACVITVIAAINAIRVWKAYGGEGGMEIKLGQLVKPLLFVARQIGTHKPFSECRQSLLSRAAHLAVFYGFITLLGLAAAAAILIGLGAPYPLPLLHPFKIAGNAATVALMWGTLYFCVQRWKTPRRRGVTSWFDWAPLTQLLLVSTTGVLSETFRYANVPLLAYPTYFLHLVFVFALMAGASNSKLAHIFYRTVALTAQQYKLRARVPPFDLQPERITM